VHPRAASRDGCIIVALVNWRKPIDTLGDDPID